MPSQKSGNADAIHAAIVTIYVKINTGFQTSVIIYAIPFNPIRSSNVNAKKFIKDKESMLNIHITSCVWDVICTYT